MQSLAERDVTVRADSSGASEHRAQPTAAAGAPWLAAYDLDHRHPINRLLHWACAPLMVIGVVGLLWALPAPSAFRESEAVLNWGTLFLLAAVVYYFIMSLSLAIGLLPFVLGVFLAVAWLDTLSAPLWALAGAALALASLGESAGHWIEQKEPALVWRDLMLLIIAPMWLLARIYRRLGIPY